MLLALALTAAVSGNVLHDQEFTIRLPAGTHAVKSRVNFETDSYSIRDARNREIASIIAGGGAYDLHGYRRYCLNGSVAWLQDGGRSGTLVIGEPGVDAISLSYDTHDVRQLRMIKRMMASLRLLEGGTVCRS